MLTQIPSRHLPSGKLDAVHAGLLSGAHANHHTILGKSHRVALRVFHADAGHDHVPNGIFRECLHATLGNNLLCHMLLRNYNIIPLLAKCHSVHLSVLDRIRDKVSLGLQYNKLSTLFRFKNCQRFGSVARRDNTVAHLLFKDQCRVLVDDIRDSSKVAKGAHGVGISGTKVRQCAGSQFCGIFWSDLVGFTFHVFQWHGNRRSGRTDVFEAGSGSKARGLS
mmetsp:Transcript_10346/g.18163  ORF Transcript_10346/g.18163 Transcript_10346/m.18163 type:complete len:222 (-) Transcript_10346:939-1604(-)